MSAMIQKLALLSSAAITLLAAAGLLFFSVSNRGLAAANQDQQTELSQLRDENQRGAACQQISQNLLNELAPLAYKADVQNALSRLGMVIERKPRSPSPTGGSGAAPTPVP
jgi:hypothetical protein